jgi:ketosteroid isomerase-like protein
VSERRSNEEIIREGFRGWSEGRAEDVIAIIDPEIEWRIAFRVPDLPPEQTIARGRAEVLEVWKRFRGVWETLTLSLEEILYDGGDTMIARARFRGVGSGSGVEIDRTLIYAMTLRDGKLLRILPFDSLEEAFATIIPFENEKF